MRSMHSSAIALVAVATATVFACNGKLEVGDEPPTAGAGGEPVDEPESTGGTAGVPASGGAQTGAGGRVAGVGGVTAGGGRGGASGGLGGSPGASGVGTIAGTGSATTGASGGGSDSNGGEPGSWVDTVTPTSPASGSSEGCPMGPILPDSACDTHGLTCGYHYELESSHDYQECACTRTRGEGLAWNCYLNWGGPQNTSCPSEPPEHGSDCFGYYGLSCKFPPQLACECNEPTEGPVWECPTPLEVPEHLEPPSAPDPLRAIADLNDEEREAWCEWFATASAGGPGFPPVADGPVDDDGYVSGVACYTSGDQFCQSAVPGLSKAQCVANLMLSECGSPISNLTACVHDVFGNVCGPFSYGCLDYLETPNCGGTIAIDSPGPTPMCRLRVE
jgi:hypothetical protein